jgi:hypothetical protein
MLRPQNGRLLPRQKSTYETVEKVRVQKMSGRKDRVYDGAVSQPTPI